MQPQAKVGLPSEAIIHVHAVELKKCIHSRKPECSLEHSTGNSNYFVSKEQRMEITKFIEIFFRPKEYTRSGFRTFQHPTSSPVERGKTITPLCSMLHFTPANKGAHHQYMHTLNVTELYHGTQSFRISQSHQPIELDPTASLVHLHLDCFLFLLEYLVRARPGHQNPQHYLNAQEEASNNWCSL